MHESCYESCTALNKAYKLLLMIPKSYYLKVLSQRQPDLLVALDALTYYTKISHDLDDWEPS